MANSQHIEDNPKKHVEDNPKVKMPGDIVVTSTPDPSSSATVVKAGVAASVPSFAAASELLSAPYSCLVLHTHFRHIALSPLHLNKKKSGIREELDAGLLKFSPSLSGVPLAYDNLRLLGQQGDIFDDCGYIHLNIQANFIVFQPKNGQTLLGKVNKLGANHVGCLVHGCFNASIPKPNRVSMETWRDEGPRIGSELEFNVTALDSDTAGVLLIRGQLIRTRVQELLAIGESMAYTVQQPDEPDANQTTQPMELSPEVSPEEAPKKKKKKKDKIKAEAVSPEEDTIMDTTLEFKETTNETLDESSDSTEKKKKKKKKKDKIKEEVGEEPLTFATELDTAMDTTAEFNGTMDETNGHVEKKKKKKKKKDKGVKEEPREVELSSVEFHCSDSSGYLSDNPSKKRKRQTQTESQEFEMPSMKKIKTEKRN